MTQITPKQTQEFLETLFRNKITEAERILQQLQEKHSDDTRYIHALKGIFQSYVGEDKDSLLYMVYRNRKMWRERKNLAKNLMEQGMMFGSKDRFFEAWNDVLNLLDKLPEPVKITGRSAD
ncbi:MAG: hypothetical protein RMI43_00245 [Candidatus Caldarchaeum sp.]|nr:hypothetical protein [Candidatus Caldarchaeum sp.]MDW8062582.1 hypothetical protein [Candidatus Caldarchaeum sp.]MDW8435700.1 hypothetical protein [Candidatus Caldarchaeum sp.]